MPLSRINSASIANSAISAADIADGTITAAKIISVANTQITGNIVSSQITSVANTQISGNIIGSQISSNTLSNTVFQTGSVENYMRGANLDFGMRNRIINGNMTIDQRNAGASVTPTNGQYTLDRWNANLSQASKYTVQQNVGSVTLPAGFTKYLGVTSSSAYSVTSTDYFFLEQVIEGFNIADLAWGTASASAVTLSFQVYSSLTGTFGGVLANSAQNRNYPYSYTISSANTWTTISVTIAGDTTGTWLTTNAEGIRLRFGLGVGSTKSGTAGAWSATQTFSATGATSVVGTNGATFYITGVQLEKGSTATSFDYRPFGTELHLCMRYYEKSYEIGTVPGTATSLGLATTGGGSTGSTTSFIGGNSQRFTVPKRTAPTVTVYDPAGNSGVCQRWQLGVSNVNNQNWVTDTPSATVFAGYSGSGSSTSGVNYHYTASAEL